MKLDPYRLVNDLPFSATAQQVRQRWGRPQHEGRNNVALNELDYGDTVFRFQDNGRLEEVTLRAPVLHLGSVAVPFHTLGAFVREQDPQAFESAGFLVSPAFGLAFDPTSSAHWVTALAAHCLDEWRALR